MSRFLSWFIKAIEESYFLQDSFWVIFVIKILNNVFNFLVGDLAVGFFFEHDVDFASAFVGILIFYVHFEKTVDCWF